MTLGSNTSYIDIFYGDAKYDTVFTDYFPSGILLNGAATTNYCYVSTLEATYDNHIGTSFRPILWSEE
jgi:hypothetical protein